MNTGAMKNVEKHVKSCEKRITDIQQETTSIENVSVIRGQAYSSRIGQQYFWL